MAESFNKKEKQKQKKKKQQEKELRKEERKANSSSGSGWESMMAYVDEFGNISSTPPDPNRKREEVNLEDIEVSIPKREYDEEEAIRRGKVTFFNESKGYGFIVDQESQQSIFVHVNGLVDPIRENDKVTFETEMGQKGLNAINVRLDKPA